VTEARRSASKPDRGIMKTAIEAVNQDGQTVMSAKATNFLLVRPDSDAPDSGAPDSGA
jgi:acyl dehydratase